jgi:DNA repair protein RecO (recombination protein O)
MPVYTSDALILRTYKLGEADRIVVFLTRDRGKKRGVAKGARRAKSRFTGATESLTRAGVAYYERELRDLVRINYIETQRSPLAMVARHAENASALGHAEYFAELIDEWAPEGHADERLYRLGSSVIDAFADGASTERLARYFEFWLLRLQGVYEVDRRLSADAQAFLAAARCSSPAALSRVEVSRAALRELETAHRALIAMHLEKDLKSVRVLSAMRSGGHRG